MSTRQKCATAGTAHITAEKENAQPITAEVKFTPENRNGKVKVTFTFDAHDLTVSTKLVVFESLYREDVEITTHKDIEDKDQTVTITPPPDVPQTGDNSKLGIWIGLGGNFITTQQYYEWR